MKDTTSAEKGQYIFDYGCHLDIYIYIHMEY